jgi:hypothetical protein
MERTLICGEELGPISSFDRALLAPQFSQLSKVM